MLDETREVRDREKGRWGIHETSSMKQQALLYRCHVYHVYLYLMYASTVPDVRSDVVDQVVKLAHEGCTSQSQVRRDYQCGENVPYYKLALISRRSSPQSAAQGTLVTEQVWLGGGPGTRKKIGTVGRAEELTVWT